MNTNRYGNAWRDDTPGASMLWPAVAAIVLLCAIFLGLLSTTADATAIGMGLGLIGGAFLLAAPRLVVWMVLALGLGTGALVSLAGPAYMKLPWAISMLSFLLWPMALLHLLQQKRTPAFIWLALAFVLSTIVSTGLQWYSAGEFIAGFKRYFQAYGLLFAFAALAFSADNIRRWQRLVLGIALLQLPFALYEFLVLVPLRGGLESGSEATDVVAGTFGANLIGGSSNAEMAAFLLIVFAFLFARWRAGSLGSGRFCLLSLLCLAPLGLGETKIVVVLLPLMGLALLRRELVKSPLRFVVVLIFLTLLTALFGYIYITLLMKSTVAEVFASTVRYNAESVGYGENLLNRSTVLSFWWSRHGWYDIAGILFGHGLGSSFLAPQNVVQGHVALHFPRHGIDLTTASTLLWDTGVIGLLLYGAVLLGAWRAANIVWRNADQPEVRADALAIQATLVLFAVFINYTNSSVNILPFEIVIAAVLGYLAWLYRNAVGADAPVEEVESGFKFRREQP